MTGYVLFEQADPFVAEQPACDFGYTVVAGL